jgi:hypothetical protein
LKSCDGVTVNILYFEFDDDDDDDDDDDCDDCDDTNYFCDVSLERSSGDVIFSSCGRRVCPPTGRQTINTDRHWALLCIA